MREVYSDSGITLINGNCLDVIQTLDDESITAMITDPPFGEQMGFDGDQSLVKAISLLSSVLNLSVSKLKPNAHVAFFWTLRNLDVAIEAVKGAGLMYRRLLLMYIPCGSARPYLAWLPRTQGIVLAQKYLPSQPTEFHAELAEYLSDVLERSSFTRSSLSKILGCDSRLVMKWTRVGDPSWCLPTSRFYKPLKELLNLDDRYDCLLTRESGRVSQSREYDYRHDIYIVENAKGIMLHPSQKPISVVRHLVDTLSEKGDLILEPFAGSGTTLVAAKELGRCCTGAETDGGYCQIAIERLRGSVKIQDTTQMALL